MLEPRISITATIETDASRSAIALRTAADRLVSAIAAHEDPEYQLAVMKRVVRRLGEDRYPLFLRLLGVVVESDSTHAKRLLAETFGVALRRMDLPGGALSSWGAIRTRENLTTVDTGALTEQFSGTSSRRLLGPVEYLTVWRLQRTQRGNLGEEMFCTTLARLITLFNYSDEARALYPQKLATDASNELEGTYTRTTRERLQIIASAWSSGRSPEDVAKAALEAGSSAVSRSWIVHNL
jgi:hypothetical protein